MTRKLLFILLTLLFSTSIAFAQTTSFTFQGKLNDGALAANGTYQFQFKLYDAASGGSQVGQTLVDIPATVTNGIFAVNLDFGAASYDGAARFIEIGVRQSGSGQNYTMLNPRQAIASTPYSVKSLKSDEATTATNSLNLGGIAANQYVQTTDTRMSDDRNPLAGSGFYIQNGTALQTVSNFNVSGEGKANIFNAIAQYNLNGVRILDGSLGGGNLFAGFESGMNSTGGGSTFVGVRAGKSNTTGIYNSFFGFQAGLSSLTTEGNSFFGSFAGMNNIGAYNSFYGSFTGRDNTTGSQNSYFGQAAGMQTTTGGNNVYFGYGAGYPNLTGANNTFLGTLAGQSNTTENDNTFIGYKANGAAGITNATAIGANSIVTTSNTMVLGTNAVTVRVPGILNVVEQYNLNGARILDGSLGSGNLFAGFEAGMNDAGGGSTFVGVSAGKNNTTGIYNSFFGFNAGLANVTTEGNSFFGTFAGINNIASGNSFFGSYAGRDNTTGIENAFFGQGTGMQTTTGKSNSFFGQGAGYSNLTGASNTFVGAFAGLSNTTENNNTFIGYKANGAAGITNATAIGANSVVTTSDTMVLGTNLVTVQVPGSLNVAGTFGANILNSATVYKIAGNRVFHLTGTDNTFVGFESGNSIASSYNAFFGSYSGKNTTTGLNNAFFGSYAGRGNITGGNNSFFGTNAGLSNKSSFNAFFGSAAGFSNINGTNNSFFGTQSGQNNENGENNSFFGRFAGAEVISGSNNTFIGALSGALNTNAAGSNNTGIGYNTKFGAGVSNSVAIGANVSVSSSNRVEIGTNDDIVRVNGEFSTSKVYTNKLDVNGSFTAGIVPMGGFEVHITGGLFTSNITSTGSGSFDSNLFTKQSVYADLNGYFDGFVMAGSVELKNMESGGNNDLCYKQIVASVRRIIASCSSSIRYKENVLNFTRGLELLRQLRPVTFNWKSDGMADVGFIAEEINRAEPLLSTFNNKGEIEGVKYAQVTTVLVNSVKEQQTQIDGLQEQIKQQQALIEALKALVCAQNPTAGVCAATEKK